LNPRNNVNYTSAETGLSEENWQGYPIFRTIPELDDVPRVLAYQEAFVEKLRCARACRSAYRLDGANEVGLDLGREVVQGGFLEVAERLEWKKSVEVIAINLLGEIESGCQG
jgi:hypothetical protein